MAHSAVLSSTDRHAPPVDKRYPTQFTNGGKKVKLGAMEDNLSIIFTTISPSVTSARMNIC
jgi:hypothetical protein